MRLGGRVRRPSLLAQFGLLSFVLLAAVGVVLANRLQDTYRERTLDDAVRSAEIVAQVGIQPLLTPADLERDFVPLDADRLETLDASLRSSVSANGVVRIKIWNRQHWIVYSDNERLVGRWFVGDDALTLAFDGVTNSFVTDLSRPEEMEERDFGRLLAVYVPLRVGDDGMFTSDPTGEVVGAFEIYLPYEPLAAAIRTDTRRLSIAIAIGFVVLYLGLFRLVAGASRRLRRQSAENAFQATHDALTGLPNRRLLQPTVERLVRRRAEGTQIALLLLDLDRFKEINDTLGHRSGDEVLCAVAARLSESASVSSVARPGGDEFVVLIEATDRAGALALADSIVALLEEPIEIRGIRLCIRTAIGVALAPDHGEDAETLLQHADVAMYVAKRSGTVCQIYDEGLDEYSPERLGLAAEVRRAIADGEIVLAYQPKLDVATGAVRGVEALVRWKHPERGIVMPGEFLPIIENTELIGPLTWHVLDVAVADAASWHRAGLDLEVAVNLSARSISDPELVSRVQHTLDRHGLPADLLELELTESAVLGDHAQASATLEALRDLGVTLAVDDFGTGYASISYLTTLPLDVLKIDRSFVGVLRTDRTAAAVVGFTMDLARHLGLRVVAEGVEDEPTLDALRDLRCDQAQGWLISRPMFAEDLLVWLAARPVPGEPSVTSSATADPVTAEVRS